jgi:hypothetical protein
MADGCWVPSESGSKALSVASRLIRAGGQRRDAVVPPAHSWSELPLQPMRKLLHAVVARPVRGWIIVLR